MRDPKVELALAKSRLASEEETRKDFEKLVETKAAALRDQKGDAAGHEFHGNRYTGGIGGAPHDPLDETPKFVTGAAHLEATHDGGSTNHLERDAAGYHIVYENRPPMPTGVRIEHFVGLGDAAKARAIEIAAGFPKSAGVRVSWVGGVAGPGGDRSKSLHTVMARASFVPDETTGQLNETGARRYRQIVAGFEKQGIPVRVPGDGEAPRVPRNAYASRAEFETALAKHMAGQ